MEVTRVFVFSSYQDYYLLANTNLSHVVSINAKYKFLRCNGFTPAIS